jgi:hypothetical protein
MEESNDECPVLKEGFIILGWLEVGLGNETQFEETYDVIE